MNGQRTFDKSPIRFGRPFWGVLAAWGLMAISGVVVAQDAADRSGKRNANKPEFSRETLKTKDGLELTAYFFPSEAGTAAIPVMIVHEWEGQSSPYGGLAAALQKAGCAVLAVDYRGHGASNSEDSPSPKLSPTTMSRRDVESIVALDLESAKAFLKQQNNAEKLNLNAMVVIGIREGAVLAASWAARDWSFPSAGRIKQGQDVKALVLISPAKQIKGVPIEGMFRSAAIMQLPIMVVAGKDSEEGPDAKKMARRIESTKRRFGRGAVEGFEEKILPTQMSGPMLVQRSRDVVTAITEFIKKSVPVSDRENPWIDRPE